MYFAIISRPWEPVRPVRLWPDLFFSSSISIPNYKLILSKRTLKLSNKAVIGSTSLIDIHACYPSVFVCLASNYSHGLATQTLLPIRS